eukprot:5257806-Prymnesium_polylepis.1
MDQWVSQKRCRSHHRFHDEVVKLTHTRCREASRLAAFWCVQALAATTSQTHLFKHAMISPRMSSGAAAVRVRVAAPRHVSRLGIGFTN